MQFAITNKSQWRSWLKMRPPNLKAVREQAEQSIKLPSHQSEWLLADAVLYLLDRSIDYGVFDKVKRCLQSALASEVPKPLVELALEKINNLSVSRAAQPADGALRQFYEQFYPVGPNTQYDEINAALRALAAQTAKGGQ